jgi:hypothetical protein
MRLSVKLRAFESLGINLPGLAVVVDLVDKCRAPRRENEVLRARLERTP